MVYCETSLIVAALTAGPDSRRVQDWLAAQEPGSLSISGLVTVEFESALNHMLRRGFINRVTRGTLTSLFHTLARDTFETIDISANAINQAAVGLRSMHTELGAMEALHLAMAWQGGATLATVDPVLAKAAEGMVGVVLV